MLGNNRGNQGKEGPGSFGLGDEKAPNPGDLNEQMCSPFIQN
jgi:hypothetical protein